MKCACHQVREIGQARAWDFGHENFPMQKKAPGPRTLAQMEDGPSAGNSTIVYFTCGDCAVEAKRVPPNGGKIMKDKFSIGDYGYIAIVTDPDGGMRLGCIL